ncbi:ABC transporter permease [Paenibacillus sp. 481]|nr:ABC transporter permease [Paenibacillus sp. 481]
MERTRFVARKLLQYAIVVWIIASLNFLLPRMMPGNPLVYLAGEDVGLMTSTQKAAIMDEHGLNDPLLVQYVDYVGQLLQGDLGFSYQQKRPVTEVLAERLPWTLLLAGANMVISTIIGVLAGSLSAWRRGTKTDMNMMIFFIFLTSMPSFWIGMMLVSVFAGKLGWFPVYGAETAWANYEGWARVQDIAYHLALPLTATLIVSVTTLYMTMRSSMIQVLQEDYMLLAKAKGLREATVKYRYAMRNALLPTATVFMLNIGFMFGGAAVIETVFSYPGIGKLMVEAVLSRDYPLIQSSFLMLTFSVLAANIISDMLYPLLDPRVGRPS